LPPDRVHAERAAQIFDFYHGWAARGLISERGGGKLKTDGFPPCGCIRTAAIALLAFVKALPMPLSAPDVLNREFLEIRCKILELAAAFDRLGRAEGSVDGDPRIARLREALQTVLDEPAGRAEQVQMVFSRPYEDGWLEQLKVKPR